MSRIGKRPIPVPKNVTVTIEGQHVKVKGPKGELERDMHREMALSMENGEIVVTRPSEESTVAAEVRLAFGSGWLSVGDLHLTQARLAEAIGLSIWACTDFGRLLFKLDPETHWPTGWRMIALQTGAVIVGYVIGTWIGDQYCGCSTFELWQRSARTFAGYLLLCIATTVAISFFFMSRGRDQRRLRQIATAQRDASEAQLKLLESQLEPHMLFNTLANLRSLMTIDPPRAQFMVDRLVKFFPGDFM